MSINELNRMRHWAQRQRALEPWRTWARLSWWKVKRTNAAKAVQNQPCDLQFVFGVPDPGRRRDPHNYVGSVVKAMVDQLVLEGVWPDDNPTYVRVLEPIFVKGEDCAIEIRERAT